MTEHEPCYRLDWDSQFFGFSIAQVVDPLLTPQRCAQIDAWCREHRVKCLYFRASTDPTTTALAEQGGFRLVDVKTRLYRTLEESFRARTVASRIRRATEADLPRLEAIAAQSHRNTRFFYDRRFPLERCEQMYRMWIGDQVKSAAHAVAVAESEGEIAGYSTSHITDRRVGFISLMAVAPEFRHRGIGDDLVHASLASLWAERASSVGVTTQAWNIAAQRVYQRCGFRTSTVDLFFHKWYD